MSYRCANENPHEWYMGIEKATTGLERGLERFNLKRAVYDTVTSRSSPCGRQGDGDRSLRRRTHLGSPTVPRNLDRNAAEEFLSSFLRIGHRLREEYRARAGAPHRSRLDELPERFHQPR